MSDKSGPTGRPVPVREMLRAAEPDEPGEAGPTDELADPAERVFDLEHERWVARLAGSGDYGTGRLGGARLAAVHFFRADAPDVPVREALIPAGSFTDLFPAELRSLLAGATPIDHEREA